MKMRHKRLGKWLRVGLAVIILRSFARNTGLNVLIKSKLKLSKSLNR